MRLSHLLTYINISYSLYPPCRGEVEGVMKHEKSRQKHNCQSVLKQLKHVVNVSHGQKPYLDYSCKVDVSFFFLFFLFFQNGAIFR